MCHKSVNVKRDTDCQLRLCVGTVASVQSRSQTESILRNELVVTPALGQHRGSWTATVRMIA